MYKNWMRVKHDFQIEMSVKIISEMGRVLLGRQCVTSSGPHGYPIIANHMVPDQYRSVTGSEKTYLMVPKVVLPFIAG